MAKKRTPSSPGDPFSKESLRAIFRTDPANPQHLLSRESGTLELKRNFHLKSLPSYGRTLAAFANASGGYIVFGVGNNPRTLSGMGNDAFSKLDPERLTDFLNETFSPELCWAAHQHSIDEATFGILHASASREKPLIAKADAGEEVRSGQIYYRYRGRTEAIRYPELRRIIDDQRLREQQLWLRHLRTIADVGVEHAAILDPTHGRLTGTAGTILIDKSVLPKLRFLREGEFREREGAPAIRLLGDAQILAAGNVDFVRTEMLPTLVRGPQVIEAFLSRDPVSAPLEYFKAVAYEASAFLPIYCYLQQAGVTRKQALATLATLPTAAIEKERLRERLEGGDPRLAHVIPHTDTPAARKKRAYREMLLAKTAALPIPSGDMRYLLQAVRSLTTPEFEPDYLLPLLRQCYEAAWAEGSTRRTELRLAICHADRLLCSGE